MNRLGSYPVLRVMVTSESSRRTAVFPKYLEDFCHHIFEGHDTRESAALIGRSSSMGPYFFNRPDVKERLAEIEKEYKNRRLRNPALQPPGCTVRCHASSAYKDGAGT